MEPFDSAADMVRWTARDLAFQASKLPADKGDWAPGPECKSAVAVMNECTGVMRTSMPVFSGGDMGQFAMPEAKTIEEASALLLETAEEYARALEKVQPGELDRPLHLPWATLQASKAVLYPIIELAHHHGHITYIQMLLGDKENHFDMPLLLEFWGPSGAGQNA
jgi:hypothetical protein